MPDTPSMPERDAVILARIDQRTQGLEREMSRVMGKLDGMDTRYVNRDEFNALKDAVSDKVNNSEFSPVRLVVFGVVGIALIAVATAIIALVVQNGGGKQAAKEGERQARMLAAVGPRYAGGGW